MPPKRRYSGTVGIAAFDTGRFSEFSLAMGRLELPPDWQIVGAFNYDLAHARNFLADNFEGDFLWLMDDDHTFRSDILKRLLSHDLDLVGPLCLGRRPPFAPCPRVAGKPIPLEGNPGLREVDETGGAGLLIRRSVFERVEPPWFAHGTTNDGGHVSDDYHFCRRAKTAGLKIFVDTQAQLSHITLVQIAPEFDDGWHRKLAIGDAVIRID